MKAYEGCACGHKLDFCHEVNASRYCGAETPNVVLRQALIECAEIAGADLSGGVPTWPSVEAWAVEAVRQLRSDYDSFPDRRSTADSVGVPDPAPGVPTEMVQR